MRILAVTLTLVAAASAALLPPNLDGQYYADDSGAYVPDSSGSYVDDGSGRYNGDRGDNGGQYVHQPDTFGDDGQYVHQPDTFGPDGGQYKDTSIYGYQVAVPSNPFPIPARLPAPPKTYLPARTPASPPFKKVEPVRVVNIPARPIFSPAPKPASRPYSPISPAPASISGSVTGQGPYKWSLSQSGDHSVDHPSYKLDVDLI